jgi:SMC interacting uncharacterized protein involved in chromosome segregation
MSTKKSNIDWLRQVIERSEKTTDTDEYKEAIEFLDAVQEEFDDLEKESEDKDDKIKSIGVECDEKDSEIRNLESRMDEMHDEPTWTTIKAGIGTIEWKSDNIQLQYVMEALGEALKTHSPNSITEYIEGMGK